MSYLVENKTVVVMEYDYCTEEAWDNRINDRLTRSP